MLHDLLRIKEVLNWDKTPTSSRLVIPWVRKYNFMNDACLSVCLSICLSATSILSFGAKIGWTKNFHYLILSTMSQDEDRTKVWEKPDWEKSTLIMSNTISFRFYEKLGNLDSWFKKKNSLQHTTISVTFKIYTATKILEKSPYKNGTFFKFSIFYSNFCHYSDYSALFEKKKLSLQQYYYIYNFCFKHFWIELQL